MTSKTAIKDKCRRTTMVPVRENPLLSDQERADLLKALKDAEARTKADNTVDYSSEVFKARLLDIYRGRKP